MLATILQVPSFKVETWPLLVVNLKESSIELIFRIICTGAHEGNRISVKEFAMPKNDGAFSGTWIICLNFSFSSSVAIPALCCSFGETHFRS